MLAAAANVLKPRRHTVRSGWNLLKVPGKTGCLPPGPILPPVLCISGPEIRRETTCPGMTISVMVSVPVTGK